MRTWAERAALPVGLFAGVVGGGMLYIHSKLIHQGFDDFVKLKRSYSLLKDNLIEQRVRLAELIEDYKSRGASADGQLGRLEAQIAELNVKLSDIRQQESQILELEAARATPKRDTTEVQANEESLKELKAALGRTLMDLFLHDTGDRELAADNELKLLFEACGVNIQRAPANGGAGPLRLSDVLFTILKVNPRFTEKTFKRQAKQILAGWGKQPN